MAFYYLKFKMFKERPNLKAVMDQRDTDPKVPKRNRFYIKDQRDTDPEGSKRCQH